MSDRFKTNFYDQNGKLVNRANHNTWSRACSIGSACAWLSCSATSTPLDHLGLVPHGQPLVLENVLAPVTLLRPHQATGVCVVDTRTLASIGVDSRLLAYRLPHIGESARRQLLERLLQFTPGQLDCASIREQPSGVDAATASVGGLYDSIGIFRLNPTMPRASTQFEGEELFPFRLLPDDGGVEFRSQYMYEYRVIADEHLAKQRSLAAQVAHCQKLLVDLPIAKRNGEAAMQEHSESDQVDLNTLGAMFLEQKRIQQEIVDQTEKLKRLGEEAKAAAAAHTDLPSSWKLHKHQTTVTLPFGRTKLGDCLYQLRVISPLDSPLAGEAAPMKLDCE